MHSTRNDPVYLEENETAEGFFSSVAESAEIDRLTGARLIRMDRAVMGQFLFHAHVTFRDLPTVIERKIIAVTESTTGELLAQVSRFFNGLFIVRLAVVCLAFHNDIVVAREAEKTIRTASIIAQRALVEAAWKSSLKRRRHRRAVRSRHKSPRQRRANHGT